jgi:primase-polymerase (primpol)-like protein
VRFSTSCRTRRVVEVVGLFDTWTELSPSGTGCDIYLLAITNIGRRQGLIEACTANRFFAVTGR